MIRRWGTLDLLDVLKDADFLAEFTDQFTSVDSREVIDRATLRRRLLLCLFALGTNIGIRQLVSTGEHGETERELRHVRGHFITRDNHRTLQREGGYNRYLQLIATLRLRPRLRSRSARPAPA